MRVSFVVDLRRWLLVAWICSLGGFAVPQPLGMISDLRGSVKLEKQSADLLDQLASGQTLTLADGSSCTVVWYGDGHRETVLGPARVQVTAGGLKGKAVLRSPASQALAALTPQAQAGSAYVAGAARFPVQPALAVSGLARVPASLPLFELPPLAAEARLYEQPSGQLVLQQSLMLEGLWAIPAYSWKPNVSYRLAFLGADGVEIASRQFQVMDHAPSYLEELAKLADINSGDPTPWIARAAVLQQDGCYDLALNAVQEAITRRPSAALLRWAANLCDRLGHASLARCYRALAGKSEK